jgi:hypothetical protein
MTACTVRLSKAYLTAMPRHGGMLCHQFCMPSISAEHFHWHFSAAL